MKKSLWTLLVSLIGAVVLVSGAFYFGAPLFGWLIIIAIFAIYALTAWNTFQAICRIARERNLASRYASLYESGNSPSDAEIEGAGILNGRIRFLRSLSARKVLFQVQDLPFLKTTWAAEEESSVRSGSGVVVLLGLMGTFFGLMLSINAAGSAIDSSATSETTLGIIQNIFSSMKGIFGSSLCGLFAALILNAIHSVYSSDREAWISELDRFTLLYLVPKSGSAESAVAGEIRELSLSLKGAEDVRASEFREMLNASKSADENRFAELKKGLSEMQASLAGNILKIGEETLRRLSESQNAALDGMRTVVRKMAEDFSEAGKGAASTLLESGTAVTEKLRDSLSSVTGGLSEEMQKLSSSVRSIESGVVNGLEKEISNLSTNMASSISNHLDIQMENSGERWNRFMEALKASTEKVAEAEQKGLEILQTVAENVASKANESTVGLSETVSREIESLSQKVQSSFAELSRSSESLVASQQSLISGIDSRVAKENESTEALSSSVAEAAKLMRVNQSELSANLEMFGKGIEAVLSKLSGDVPERENEQNFIEQLNSALQSFEERSGEVLLENALKTQEILLEILDQVQKAPAKPKAE